MEGRQTRTELLIGIFIFLVLFMAGNLVFQEKLAYTLGLLLGGAVAVGMLFHMYTSLERGMLYEEETAKKKMKLAAVLRMCAMLAALVAAVLLPKYFSVIGVILGVLCLKFSAFLQPLTHKVLKKILNKGR